MRRFVFIFILAAGICSFAIACTRQGDIPKIEGEVYFVDARLNRLLPYSADIIDGSPEDMARDVLRILIEGRDDDDKIRRIIPKDNSSLSVRVNENVAYVDIKSKLLSKMNFNCDTEKLFIYQIVNSLTSIKGIRFVKFTIDGDIRRDFIGFYDMRDTYKFQYPEI